MVLLQPKTEPVEAWQWIGQDQSEWPSWVSACCNLVGITVLLKRRSGAQVVYLGEWLVRDLDGEPEWYMNCQINRKFNIK